MFSAANGAPDSMGPILLLPLLFTFFAVLGRVSARMYWRNFGKRKPHWWYVYPLLALALITGFDWIYKLYFMNALDREMYLQTLIGTRLRIAHHLAFFIPLIATVWILLYDWKEAGRERQVTARP